MKKRLPYIPIRADAEIARCCRLTAEETGVYHKLRMILWSADGKLENDDHRVAMMLGLTLKKWKSLRPKMETIFTFSDAITLPEMIPQREKIEKIIEQKRIAGEATQKKKRLKNIDSPSADAQITGQRLGQQNGSNTKTKTKNSTLPIGRGEEGDTSDVEIVLEGEVILPPDSESITPRAGAKPPTAYAFFGTTIRLNAADFEKWKAAYSAIPDLRAELTGLDDWWQDRPPEARKKWFHSTSGMLSRKHQEHLQNPGKPHGKITKIDIARTSLARTPERLPPPPAV